MTTKDSNSSPKIDKSPYLKTDLKKGLSLLDVQKRQRIFGKNEIKPPKPKSIILIFLSQLKDLLIVLLFIATIAAFAIAIENGIQSNFDFTQRDLVIQFVQPFIILAVVIGNACLGTWQELKSNSAVAALRSTDDQRAKVLRNGELINLRASEVTIGDILFIEAGDKIHADGKILESNNLFCIEAPLTGESLPTEKGLHLEVANDNALGDQRHYVFSGCSVSNGSASILVEKIAYETEIGKISNLLDIQKSVMTPLQIKLNKLSKFFGYSGIVAFVFVFLSQVGLLGFENIAQNWSVALVSGVALAVAVIPEGLSAFTTIVLAVGVSKMAKRKAIMKRLAAVETLGSASIICSDKTGTLTQNKMTILGLWTLQDHEGMGMMKTSHQSLIKYSLACTEAQITLQDGEENEVGDPTELAIVKYALDQKITKSILHKEFPRVSQIPFDSNRKMMTVINKSGKQLIAIVKGAPENILLRSNNLNSELIKEIEDQLDFYAKKAYRTLAIATKKISQKELESLDEKEIEKDLHFIGIISMIDPPRKESKKAIALSWKAGIKPIMITGDHPQTARAIASEIGIVRSEKDLVITSKELNALSDEELAQNIQNYAVYARVSPHDKIRVVKAWQKHDQVVAMTGDGVNDAPALKAADIGCAMGITGTDVSKEAADVILVDDNYQTIIRAVDAGRNVYEKIRKVILNLLVLSVAATLSVIVGLFVFNLVYRDQINRFLSLEGRTFDIFSGVQLLWINLIVHGLPAIALGLEEGRSSYLDSRPFSKHETIFARSLGIKLAWQGILISTLTLGAYAYGMEKALNSPDPEFLNRFGATAGFLTLGISASINAFNLVENRSVIFAFNGKRKYLYAAVSSSLVALILVNFVPQLASVFGLTTNLPKNIDLFWVPLLLSLIPTLIWEIVKFVTKLFKKTHAEIINDFKMIQRPKNLKKRIQAFWK